MVVNKDTLIKEVPDAATVPPPETTEWRWHSGSRATACSGCSCGERRTAITGAQFKPRTTPYITSKPLLEWQEGVSHLLEMKEGVEFAGFLEGQEKVCPTYWMWRKGQGLGILGDRRVSHLLDWWRKGWGLQGPHLGTCREAPGLSTGWCSHS